MGDDSSKYTIKNEFAFAHFGYIEKAEIATKKLGESDEDEEENDQNIQESSREIAEIVIPQGQHRTIETKATKQI